MPRSSSYTEEIGDEICARIAAGESLRSICKDDHMPVMSTVMLWVVDGKHVMFSEQYAEARRNQAEVLADELMEIADNGRNDFMEQSDDGGGVAYKLNGEHIQRSRLRVDTRKWYLSKVLPKFADKQQIEHSGKIDYSNISDEELDRKLNDLIANQTAKN
jgi:hypothetical protein